MAAQIQQRSVKERYENPDRLLRARDVSHMIGFCRGTIYKFMADRNFPKPIKIDNYAARWLESEVQAWIQDQITAHRGKADS